MDALSLNSGVLSISPRRVDNLMAEMKYKIVRLTLTVDYLVHDTPRMGDVLKEWFTDPRYPLSHLHAYRDGSKIGYSEKVLSYKVLTPEERSSEKM